MEKPGQEKDSKGGPGGREGSVFQNTFRTLLTRACERDDATHVEGLLRAGLDPNARLGGGSRWSPLSEACRLGAVGCAEALLDAGARVDEPDDDGWSPMCMATDHPECLALLLARGADPSARDAKHGISALMAAVGNPDKTGLPKRLASASLLIAAGADVEAVAATGQRAMDVAVAAGHGEAVALLLAVRERAALADGVGPAHRVSGLRI